MRRSSTDCDCFSCGHGLFYPILIYRLPLASPFVLQDASVPSFRYLSCEAGSVSFFSAHIFTSFSAAEQRWLSLGAKFFFISCVIREAHFQRTVCFHWNEKSWSLRLFMWSMQVPVNYAKVSWILMQVPVRHANFKAYRFKGTHSSCLCKRIFKIYRGVTPQANNMLMMRTLLCVCPPISICFCDLKSSAS